MKYNEMIAKGILDTQGHSMLNGNSFAKIFDVVNLGENSYFNMGKSIYFEDTKNTDTSYYMSYSASSTDTWPLLSYRFYNTVQLWWLICKFNGIRNPLDKIQQGQLIAIPSKQLVQIILATMEA